MNAESLELLEYEALKQLVGRYVASPLGDELLGGCAPLTDRTAIEGLLEDTAEAVSYLRADSEPQPAARGAAIGLRFGALADPRPAAGKLRIDGAVLEGKEIHELTELLERAGDVRLALRSAEERFPRLGARAALLADFRGLLKELAGKILPDGSVADDASVALGRIRRDIERQRKQIQESLERFLRSHREDGVLQEEFVTLRNDRFVVPVVPSQKRRINGVIHGASASGHTVFVEPLDTIELNNDLVRLNEEELREVHRILLDLTRRLREHRHEIAGAIQVMGELDFLFAKGRFALEFDCVVPRFSPEGSPRLMLAEARHPLLEDVLRRQKKRVVPVSVSLENATHMLLISGPNTGGKTVTLKTVGLLALMAQSGLPVPAAEAEFPLFDQVLADIGDNQSIEQSLSSFSAHVARIREMLLDVTAESLVLLDELGRATDPEEGGALGIAVLDRFRGRRAFTFVSTHLLAIKVWGANTPSVLNASMGFDDQTLMPTYVLRAGAPGKSATLDIAGRLGLPPDLIEQARAAMSGMERDIAHFLKTLDQRIGSLAAAEQELRRQKEAAAAEQKALREDAEKRESRKVRELEEKFQALVARFDKESKQTINAIASSAEQKKVESRAHRQAARLKREFEQEMETTLRPTAGAVQVAAGEIRPEDIAEGMRVKLRSIRELARVNRVLGGGRLEVEAGFMRLQVSLDEVLEILPPAAGVAPKMKNVSFQAGPAWNDSYREINLIGKHVEEALDELDKFLDSAALAGVSQVRVIHGHGMGKLKRAVAGFLKDHPHVEKWHPGTQDEGGTGATIAELKE